MDNTSALPNAFRWRIAVSVFFFLAGFTFASWASRIPHIQVTLGLSEVRLGTVLFALPVGLMVSLLAAGGIITKFGSKRVMIFAACLYSCILILLGLASSFWQLAGVLFLFGIAGNLFNISVNTQAVGVEKMYGRSIMATFHGIWSLAGFAGAAIGSIMTAFYLPPFSHFVIVSISCLIVTVFFARNTHEPMGIKTNNQGFVLPDKRILQLGIIAFCCLVCEGTMFDWSGVYFKKAIQAPAHLTTLGYAAFMGCMAAGRFVADKAVMKFGSKNMIIYSGITIFFGLLLAVVFPNLTTATIGFMLVGFGVSSVVPIVYSKAGQSKTMHSGQALAAVSTVGFAGFLAGPPLIGFLAEATSLRWSFAVVALIGLTTSVLAKKIL
jgi:MFS family permease